MSTALRLTESATYPSGALQLTYETVGAPTYGNLAIEDQGFNTLPEMTSERGCRGSTPGGSHRPHHFADRQPGTSAHGRRSGSLEPS